MSINKNKIIFAIIFQIFTISTFSQNSENIFQKYNYTIEPKIQRGFIFAHYESFRYFINDNVTSYEINCGIKTRGTKTWQNIYNKPIVGVGFYYANLGNEEVLGDVKAAFTYFNSPILSSKYLDLNFNFALGLSYLKTVFDPIKNNYNLALGSHLNAYINFCLEPRININKNLQLVSGMAFTHFSNGSMKMPNRGLNLISLRFGVNYIFDNKPIEPFEKKNLEKYKKNFDLFINYSFGYRETYPVSDDRKYLINSLVADYGLNTNYKSRLSIGLDFVHNTSRITKIDTLKYPNPGFSEFFTIGTHIGFELKIGDVSFIAHQGFYLYSNPKNESILYQRWGFKYKVTRHIFLNLSLRTLFVTAKWIEWGAGFYF